MELILQIAAFLLVIALFGFVCSTEGDNMDDIF